MNVKAIAMFNIMLVVMLPLYLSSVYAQVDNVPPVLTLDTTPTSVNTAALNVSGTTEADATVSFSVNTVNQGSVTAGASGKFWKVVNLASGSNNVKVVAADAAGNEAEQSFSVDVDTTAPVITLRNFTETVAGEIAVISGDVDETSDITIYNNDAMRQVFNDATTFTHNLQLGPTNNVKITAEDAAGNIGVVEKSITMIAKPTISLIYPNISKTTTSISVSKASQTLEGKTTPGATVEITVYTDKNNKPTEPTVTAVANGSGYWSAEIKLDDSLAALTLSSANVPMQGMETVDAQAGAQMNTIGGTTPSMVSLTSQSSVPNYIEIVAKDDYNRSSEVITLTFNIQSCGQGLDWTVTVEPDEHYWRPYRLMDGTETVNFVIKLDYIGVGEYDKIDKVWIMPMPETEEMKNDPNYACYLREKGNIFPNRPVYQWKNSNRTMWYISYRLNKWRGFNETNASKMISEWKDFEKLITNQCILPLKIVISYKVKGSTYSLRQETCFSSSHYINPQVDPNLVIPEAVLDVSLAVLNTTGEVLNAIEPVFETAAKYISYGCWGALVAHMAMGIKTRFACNKPSLDSTTQADDCAKAIKAEKAVYYVRRMLCDRIWCPATPINPGTGEDAPGSPPQTRTHIGDRYPEEGRCKTDPDFICLKYRDFLAEQGTPIGRQLCGPFAEDVSRFTVDCNPQFDSDTGTPLQQSINVNDLDRPVCCKLLTSMRAGYDEVKFMNASEWDTAASLKLEPEECFDKVASQDKDEIKGTGNIPGIGAIEPWDYGRYMGYVSEYMKSNGEACALLPEASSEQLSVVVGPGAYIYGQTLRTNTMAYIDGLSFELSTQEEGGLPLFSRINPEQIKEMDTDEQTNNYLLVDPDSNQMDELYEKSKDKNMVYKDGSFTIEKETKDGMLRQDFRVVTTVETDGEPRRVYAPLNQPYKKRVVRYVDGLHKSSCFGQSRVWLSNDLFFDPSQNFFASIQCACISDLYGRIQQYRNIVNYMSSCLNQIKETGKADAGACKEMFSQYVCDLLSWILVKGFAVKYKSTGQSQQVVGTSTASIIGMGLQDSMDRLLTDYGSVLQRGQAGINFDLNSMSHMVCMGALFHQWDPGFEALFRGDAGGMPRQSSVVVYPATRELLGYNPGTGIPNIEYRMGLSFSSGSNLRFVKVLLVCDEEGDCPKAEKIKLFRTANPDELAGGVVRDVEKNAFVSKGGYMQVNSDTFRYNKIRVVWQSLDGTKYSGEHEFDIDEIASVKFFDCKVVPSAGLDGNDMFSCKIFADQSYARFLQPLPSSHNVILQPGEQKPVGIPFTVQAVYGDTTDPSTSPFILRYEKMNAAGEALAAPINHKFTESTTMTSEQLSGHLITEADLRGSDPTATKVILDPTQQTLTQTECPGEYLSSPDVITCQGQTKDVPVPAGETIYDELCSFKFRLDPLDKEYTCRLTVNRGSVSGQAQLRFKVGLYTTRYGGDEIGDAVFFEGAKQEKEVSVQVSRGTNAVQPSGELIKSFTIDGNSGTSLLQLNTDHVVRLDLSTNDLSEYEAYFTFQDKKKYMNANSGYFSYDWIPDKETTAADGDDLVVNVQTKGQTGTPQKKTIKVFVGKACGEHACVTQDQCTAVGSTKRTIETCTETGKICCEIK